MALTQQQRDSRVAEKRVKFAEKELRHRVRPGIELAIQRIRDRSENIAISELLQVAVMKMDLMGDDELKEFLSYPRHEIMVSEIVARAIYDAGLRNVIGNPDQDPDDQILAPSSGFSLTPRL